MLDSAGMQALFSYFLRAQLEISQMHDSINILCALFSFSSLCANNTSNMPMQAFLTLFLRIFWCLNFKDTLYSLVYSF